MKESLYVLEAVCVHGVWVGSEIPCRDCRFLIFTDQSLPPEQRMPVVFLTPDQVNANAGRDYTFDPFGTQLGDPVDEYQIKTCSACSERYVILDAAFHGPTFCPRCGTRN